MKFESIDHAKQFEKQNIEMLNNMLLEVEQIESVQYGDVWLNSKAPSFIAGFNDEDEIIVCIPIN